MKVIHGNVKIEIEDFEHGGWIWGGDLWVQYVRDTDGSITWVPELLRMTDNEDWRDDDKRKRINFSTSLAHALFQEWQQTIEDECRDDCRWI